MTGWTKWRQEAERIIWEWLKENDGMSTKDMYAETVMDLVSRLSFQLEPEDRVTMCPSCEAKIIHGHFDSSV